MAVECPPLPTLPSPTPPHFAPIRLCDHIPQRRESQRPPWRLLPAPIRLRTVDVAEQQIQDRRRARDVLHRLRVAPSTYHRLRSRRGGRGATPRIIPCPHTRWPGSAREARSHDKLLYSYKCDHSMFQGGDVGSEPTLGATDAPLPHSQPHALTPISDDLGRSRTISGGGGCRCQSERGQIERGAVRASEDKSRGGFVLRRLCSPLRPHGASLRNMIAVFVRCVCVCCLEVWAG